MPVVCVLLHVVGCQLPALLQVRDLMPNAVVDIVGLGMPLEALPQKKSTAKANYTIVNGAAKIEVQLQTKTFRVQGSEGSPWGLVECGILESPGSCRMPQCMHRGVSCSHVVCSGLSRGTSCRNVL
jgi:hypothetical protein